MCIHVNVYNYVHECKCLQVLSYSVEVALQRSSPAGGRKTPQEYYGYPLYAVVCIPSYATLYIQELICSRKWTQVPICGPVLSSRGPPGHKWWCRANTDHAYLVVAFLFEGFHFTDIAVPARAHHGPGRKASSCPCYGCMVARYILFWGI